MVRYDATATHQATHRATYRATFRVGQSGLRNGLPLMELLQTGLLEMGLLLVSGLLWVSGMAPPAIAGPIDTTGSPAELSDGMPAELSELPQRPVRPAWLTVSEAILKRTNQLRVSAEAPTLDEVQSRLEHEIDQAIYKQLVLHADHVRLPAGLAAELNAEEVDRSALAIERFVERMEGNGAGSSGLRGYQGWARIHSSPAFTASVDRQMRTLVQRERVGRVGVVAAVGLLAVVLSFGYLQGLRQLAGPWPVRGLVVLGFAWAGAVTAVVATLVLAG